MHNETLRLYNLKIYFHCKNMLFFFTKSTTPKWLAKVFKKIGESIFECTLNQPHVAQLLCKVLWSICYFMSLWICAYAVCLEVRRQLSVVGSLLQPCRFWRLNLDLQGGAKSLHTLSNLIGPPLISFCCWCCLVVFCDFGKRCRFWNIISTCTPGLALVLVSI